MLTTEGTYTRRNTVNTRTSGTKRKNKYHDIELAKQKHAFCEGFGTASCVFGSALFILLLIVYWYRYYFYFIWFYESQVPVGRVFIEYNVDNCNYHLSVSDFSKRCNKVCHNWYYDDYYNKEKLKQCTICHPPQKDVRWGPSQIGVIHDIILTEIYYKSMRELWDINTYGIDQIEIVNAFDNNHRYTLNFKDIVKHSKYASKDQQFTIELLLNYLNGKNIKAKLQSVGKQKTNTISLDSFFRFVYVEDSDINYNDYQYLDENNNKQTDDLFPFTEIYDIKNITNNKQCIHDVVIMKHIYYHRSHIYCWYGSSDINAKMIWIPLMNDNYLQLWNQRDRHWMGCKPEGKDNDINLKVHDAFMNINNRTSNLNVVKLESSVHKGMYIALDKKTGYIKCVDYCSQDKNDMECLFIFQTANDRVSKNYQHNIKNV
eukprot:327858_1